MTSTTNSHEAPSEQPWYSAYPAPRSENRTITAAAVLDLLKAGSPSEQRFVLVDVRRADFEGGTIQGSINLPAQSLYPTISSIYDLFKAAGVRRVMWYCGTRTAAWFADHLQERKDTQMESLVLVGGIKGWIASGEDYIRHVKDYDASKWA